MDTLKENPKLGHITTFGGHPRQIKGGISRTTPPRLATVASLIIALIVYVMDLSFRNILEIFYDLF
ncbi:hypothetical protein N9Y89_00390 [bacterium]|nr:hypothetical protein [bacterium]